ncbi:MAG: DUF4157 domain-containing protein [bacterium]|nr:DUF4157 domain-containing protein [bacterium]
MGYKRVRIHKKEEEKLQRSSKMPQKFYNEPGSEFDLMHHHDAINQIFRKTTGIIQAREFPGNEPVVSSNVESGINSIKGKGEPLSQSARNFFEPRFYKADFSKVRIHRGTHADKLANDVNARAFTLGNDIVFGKGEYNPSSKWSEPIKL